MRGRTAACLLLALWSRALFAADFRAASEEAVVLYDAPSAQSKKMFVVSQGYPLEECQSLLIPHASQHWFHDHFQSVRFPYQQTPSRREFVHIDSGRFRHDITQVCDVPLGETIKLRIGMKAGREP